MPRHLLSFLPYKIRESRLTPRRHHGEMDASDPARLRQHQRANNIALDSFGLVVFTPVNVWSACLASAIDHMGRLDFIQHLINSYSVFHSHAGGIDVFVLSTEKIIEMAGNPPILAPDQRPWLHDGLFYFGLRCVRTLETNTIHRSLERIRFLQRTSK